MGELVPNAPDGVDRLTHLLDASEIISPSSPEYLANTQTWSPSKDKHPKFVLRPSTLESLSKVVAYLSDSDLHYKARSQGFGSASAADVLISLSAFDNFEFNEEEEYVMLGAGGSWKGYYDRMQDVAPGWSSKRPPFPRLQVDVHEN